MGLGSWSWISFPVVEQMCGLSRAPEVPPRLVDSAAKRESYVLLVNVDVHVSGGDQWDDGLQAQK